MRLGLLCADPPLPLRCAPCNYADRRLHFTGRGCGLLHHRCKVRHPRPIWKVLVANASTPRSLPALSLYSVDSTTEVRTVLVEARSPAQSRRLFSTIKSQGSTDTVDLFTGHTAFRLSLCLTLALCSTIRLERQRSSANSVASSLLRWILNSSRPVYLSVARRSKFFKMEENSWS